MMVLCRHNISARREVLSSEGITERIEPLLRTADECTLCSGVCPLLQSRASCPPCVHVYTLCACVRPHRPGRYPYVSLLHRTTLSSLCVMQG